MARRMAARRTRTGRDDRPSITGSQFRARPEPAPKTARTPIGARATVAAGEEARWEDVADRRHELLGREGLVQQRPFVRQLDVAGVAGEVDQRQARPVVAQAPGELDARDRGHDDVGQDDVDLVLVLGEARRAPRVRRRRPRRARRAARGCGRRARAPAAGRRRRARSRRAGSRPRRRAAGSSGTATSASGRSSVKRVPAPRVESRSMRPPARSTMP